MLAFWWQLVGCLGSAEHDACLLPQQCSAVCSVCHAQGWRPLHSATSAGHEPVARLLISLGADVNAANAQQRTPLHYAASKGQRELVELLLQHGAQVRSPGVRTPPPRMCSACSALAAAGMARHCAGPGRSCNG